jgi:hypothetical protein
MNYPKNNNPIQIGSQIYYGGIDNPNIGQVEQGKVNLGFGHGHINPATGYNRPPVGGPDSKNVTVENAIANTSIMGTFGKPNVDIGGGNR